MASKRGQVGVADRTLGKDREGRDQSRGVNGEKLESSWTSHSEKI